MSADSIISTEYRLATGADSLWGIDVDATGRVYVTTIGVAPNKGKVLVFKGFQQEQDAWAVTHTLTPLATLTIPDTGRTRGVAVNGEGTAVYISNWDLDKIYCFTGSPAAGYPLNPAFNGDVHDTLTATSGVPYQSWTLGFRIYGPKKCSLCFNGK